MPEPELWVFRMGVLFCPGCEARERIDVPDVVFEALRNRVEPPPALTPSDLVKIAIAFPPAYDLSGKTKTIP